MQIPGPWPRWLISVSLRTSQKHLHFDKHPCDPNVHSSLKAMLPELPFAKFAEHHMAVPMEIVSPWLWSEVEGKKF